MLPFTKSVNTNKSSFLEQLVVMETLFLSGAYVVVYGALQSVLLVVWVLTTFFLFLKQGHLYNYKNILLLGIVIVWILINNFVLHSSFSLFSSFQLICFAIGGFFMVHSFNFYSFRELILSELALLSIISIIVAFLYKFGVIGATTTNLNRNLAFFFFNVDGEDNRLSSIYWEPGQYQIIIMYVLCLFTDKLKVISGFFKDYRFIVLVLSLLLTISTTGYISLMLLLLGIFISGKTKLIYKLLLIPVGLGLMLLLFYSPAIQNKFKSGNVSFIIRMNDNKSAIDMVKQSPLIGYGLDTIENNEKEDSTHGAYNASNGWLTGMARSGIPFVSLFLLSIIINLKKMPHGINLVFIFLTLFVSQCNEWYIYYPIMYMYVFAFNLKRGVSQTITSPA